MDDKTYIEEKRQEFYEGDPNVREAILEELRAKNFLEEADDLEKLDKEDDINYGKDKDEYL